MQKDFHYYATYCAAYLAGYSHQESLDICYSAQFVDWCSAALLSRLKAPRAAATTQLQLELMDARTDLLGLQDITRIWSSFHFLPYQLKPRLTKRCKQYMDKYALICDVNGDLVVDTVKLAKGRSLQAVGVAMHVLADTWAHRYFAGTPSLVINNTNYYFYELFDTGHGVREQRISFRHNASAPDDLEHSIYTNTIFQSSEKSIMNLGHGRAGHLPDYSFIRYKYLPAWGEYEEIVKNNPSDYLNAFCQMIYAMKYLRGAEPDFVKNRYDVEAIAPWEARIKEILTRRQLDACEDWRALAQDISGETIEDFDLEKYQNEYLQAAKNQKDDTFLGKFILAALAQKSMVTDRIFKSGNLLAGFSLNFDKAGLWGMRDYYRMVRRIREESQ